MSFPEPDAVAQINRATGELVATYGDRVGQLRVLAVDAGVRLPTLPEHHRDRAR